MNKGGLLIVAMVAACAANGGAQSTSSEEALGGVPVATPSACRGIVGQAATGYRPTEPNLGRELADAVDTAYVSHGQVWIPGLLRASWTTTPYAWAATLELSQWSMISNDSYAEFVPGRLYARLTGAPAQVLYDALTRAAQTTENDAETRSTALRSVVCQSYTGGAYQCFVGPVDTISPASTCP